MRPDDADTAPTRRKRFLRHHDQVAAARRFVTDTLPRGSELRETARLLVPFSAVEWRYFACSGQGIGIVRSSRMRRWVPVSRSSTIPSGV